MVHQSLGLRHMYLWHAPSIPLPLTGGGFFGRILSLLLGQKVRDISMMNLGYKKLIHGVQNSIVIPKTAWCVNCRPTLPSPRMSQRSFGIARRLGLWRWRPVAPRRLGSLGIATSGREDMTIEEKERRHGDVIYVFELWGVVTLFLPRELTCKAGPGGEI